MARDIDAIERGVLTPTQNVSAGSSFDKLADASSGLANIITDEISTVAAEEAVKQGEADALSGQAPKTLAPGLNKVTRAYNDAVSNTEARHQVLSAQTQLNEAYAKRTDPRNFTSESPAYFKTDIEGITQGTLQNVRPENRAKVALALENMAGTAQVNMLNHSIDFENKQTIKTMTTEIDQLVKDRRNYAIQGDTVKAAIVDDIIKQSLSDYSVQNAAVRRLMPEINRKLEQGKVVDDVVAGYAEALSLGKQDEYMSKFGRNEGKLPFDTWEMSAKAIVALDTTEQKLRLQVRAEENQTVLNGIQNGTITTTDEINNYHNLSGLDQLKLQGALEKHNQAQAKTQYNLKEAQKDIVQGNQEFIPAKQKNQMFTNARHEFEKINQAPMAIGDEWDSINGRGPVPTSGIPGQSMNTNVPQVDAKLNGMLTGKDYTQVAQAAMIWNDAVNVQQTPNMVNLSKEATAIASHYTTMMQGGGGDSLAVAEQVSKTTLDAKAPQMEVRSSRFTAMYSGTDGHKNMNSVFKQVFDTKYVPGVADNAYGFFKETYREQFLMADSDESALNATKYLMRAWGTSKFFQEGQVAQPVPEKELAIANVGFAFKNQLMIKTQKIINNNKAAHEGDSPPALTIEWSNPKVQNIDLNNISDKDRVFKELGDNTDLHASLYDRLTRGDKPLVKINGQETEIFLMPTPESRL